MNPIGGESKRRSDSVELSNENDETVALENERVVERVRETGPPVPPPGAPLEGYPVEPAASRQVLEDERVRVLPDGSVERQLDRHEVGTPTARRRPGTGIAAAFLVLLVVLLAVLAALWYFGRDGGDTVAVPTVVGLQIGDAVAQLENDGLQASVTRGPSEEPAGTVIRQAPVAGTDVDKGSRVDVAVSEGAADVTVPNATGIDEGLARDRLAGAQLKVEVVKVFSEEPAGTVIAQSPAAGEETGPETVVRLEVSKGSGVVVVPSLVGQSRDAAEASLSELGLEANVVRVPSDEPAETVVAQNPTSGEVKVGSTVRLNVSAGR